MTLDVYAQFRNPKKKPDETMWETFLELVGLDVSLEAPTGKAVSVKVGPSVNLVEHHKTHGSGLLPFTLTLSDALLHSCTQAFIEGSVESKSKFVNQTGVPLRFWITQKKQTNRCVVLDWMLPSSHVHHADTTW